MNVVGIVAEYNPFHNGHEYQIRRARELYGPDTPVVAVMSGYFVQRGEPAVADKWIRAEAALRCGADLVIEIPFTFACASAERFALGAIRLLQATGVVTDLYFGSECDDLALLCCVAEEYDEEDPVYISSLREYLREGKSYAKARELAVGDFFRRSGREELAKASSQIMSMPNSILALEYLIALRKIGSTIRPTALLREGAGYNECSLDSPFASATGIRSAIDRRLKDGVFRASELVGELRGKLPDTSLALLLADWQKGTRPVMPRSLIGDQIMAIRARAPEELEKYAYMSDNVCRRLRNAVGRIRDTEPGMMLNAFREESDTRRFAPTRIFRAMTSMLVGQTEKDLADLSEPRYLRVLGFSDRGRNLLRIMRKSAGLPLIDKASDFLAYGGDASLTRMAELDLISADLWGLKAGLRYGAEFERTVVRLTASETKRRS
jgi:predicted nucleotidyltransferase